MTKIDFNTYLLRIKDYEYHFYDIPSETCYFPFQKEEIDMVTLSNELNKFGEYLNHNESFQERKDIAENNKEWIKFTWDLRRKQNYTCEISGFRYKDIKRLSHELFNILNEQTWINNYLVIHHLNDDEEYECYDKSKLLVLNRAIHMILHRYKNLLPLLPNLKDNYELWFELGCLIHDRNGEYPWRNITKAKKQIYS